MCKPQSPCGEVSDQLADAGVHTMRKATGLGLPLTLLVKGYTDRPPVLRPIRSVSSMKLSFSVPICVSALHT